jgi:hypothetical protein
MMHAIAAAVMAVAIAQASTGSQAPSPTPQSPPAVVEVFRAAKNGDKSPFERVVLAPARVNATVTAEIKRVPTMPQWKVECGIKVMVVSPDIDPKSIITAPQGGPEPKIRRISPPPCPERDSK